MLILNSLFQLRFEVFEFAIVDLYASVSTQVTCNTYLV
jgi:hypothetical protein